jgi:hypothetical protein
VTYQVSTGGDPLKRNEGAVAVEAERADLLSRSLLKDDAALTTRARARSTIASATSRSSTT